MRRLAWIVVVAACHSGPSKLDDHFAPETITEVGSASAKGPSTGASDPISADQITGTVVETMPAATYTYARLDHGGRDVWIAGPETPLVVGAKIGPVRGTLMTAFHSDTLNRTFDQIYFVDTFGQPVPPTHATAPAAATAPALGGTVVETMDAGGYTYAQLDANGVKTWVAGPPTKLAVGTKLAGLTGTLMTGFHSSTLNRTFDQIYFVNAMPSTTTATTTTPPAAPAAPAAPAPPDRVEPIARAPGGKTVAEVFAGRATLEGKKVDVHGKVVKVTSGVMDRNWLHLRDGTGAAGANDLIVTTTETVSPGDVVTVHGTVGTNRDLGAGYHYDVLIENATLTR